MSIVQTDIPVTSETCDRTILALTAAYPFLRSELLGTTAFGRPLRTLVFGNGPRKVIFTAAHHANEWITTLILLQYAEDLAKALTENTSLYGIPAAQIRDAVTIYMLPLVDPDGVDLVTGAIAPESPSYLSAAALAEFYPNIPFPSGWKANLLGVDLNLQYPAGWLEARQIKFSQGFTRPGPRDYVGRAPLDQIESRLLAGYTEFIQPELVLAFHTQGKEIYWQFRQIPVPGARELADAFAAASGYTVADTPYESSFAGYKDWFIQKFRKPGFTIEAGSGVNPLPLAQFSEIYRDNLGILTIAALGFPVPAPENS